MNYTYYRRYRPSPRRSNFKSFFWLVLVLVVLLLVLRACVSVASSLLKDKEDEATLSVNHGSAEVMEWGQSEAHAASDAQLFLMGDTVETMADSSVTLTFTNGTQVTLDELSKLRFVEAQLEETEKLLEVELMEGRAFVQQNPEDENQVKLALHTDVMNVDSFSAHYLISNRANKEYVYGFQGQTTVRFVDRSQGDSVIETVTLEQGKKTILTDEDERRLLARESVTLLSEAGDDLLGDAFVAFVRGESVGLGQAIEENEALVEDEVGIPDAEAEAEAEAEAVESTEEPADEVLSSLEIKVTSPGLNSTIQKNAIAIEGSIVKGAADRVTVTWDGNGQPYTLAGFKPGDSTFRYVADASYGNFKAGANTFTVVAYAADGTASKPVTVVITAEF